MKIKIYRKLIKGKPNKPNATHIIAVEKNVNGNKYSSNIVETNPTDFKSDLSLIIKGIDREIEHFKNRAF